VVVVPEFNVDLALRGARLPEVLQLFEGAGAAFKSNLYERFAETKEATFAGTFFLLASNRIPEWAVQKDYPELYRDQWEPLMTRVELVKIEESWVNSACFPYDAIVLAGAIKQVLKKVEDKIPIEQIFGKGAA